MHIFFSFPRFLTSVIYISKSFFYFLLPWIHTIAFIIIYPHVRVHSQHHGPTLFVHIFVALFFFLLLFFVVWLMGKKTFSLCVCVCGGNTIPAHHPVPKKKKSGHDTHTHIITPTHKQPHRDVEE